MAGLDVVGAAALALIDAGGVVRDFISQGAAGGFVATDGAAAGMTADSTGATWDQLGSTARDGVAGTDGVLPGWSAYSPDSTFGDLGPLSFNGFPTPPVALDLDGDGLEFVANENTDAAFDFDGDGVAEQTPWLSADDAWLAIDLDLDGLVSNRNELVFADLSPEAGDTDLEAIRSVFDDNGDGVLSSADSAFSQFVLWQDANSDGVSDAGEVSTLAEAGIESIGLVSDGASVFSSCWRGHGAWRGGIHDHGRRKPAWSATWSLAANGQQ